MDVSDAVGQRVGAQQGGGALRPVHRHQRVLAHQHLPDVLGTCYPDQRSAQQMSLEHVPVLLPPRCVETGTLPTAESGDFKTGKYQRNKETDKGLIAPHRCLQPKSDYGSFESKR